MRDQISCIPTKCQGDLKWWSWQELMESDLNTILGTRKVSPYAIHRTKGQAWPGNLRRRHSAERARRGFPCRVLGRTLVWVRSRANG